MPRSLIPQMVTARVGDHLTARRVPARLHDFLHRGGPGLGALCWLGALLVELVPPPVDLAREPIVQYHATSGCARGGFTDGGVLGEELVRRERPFVVEAMHLKVGGTRGQRLVVHPAWKSRVVGESSAKGGGGGRVRDGKNFFSEG